MLSKRITDTWIVNELNFNLSFDMFSTSIVDHTTPRKLCVQIPGREYISGMQVITLTHNRKLVVFNVTLTGSLSIERLVITKCTTCCNI